MRKAFLAIAASAAALSLAACGGSDEGPSADLQAKQEAAARDADKAPLTPEQDKATADLLAKDLEAWK